MLAFLFGPKKPYTTPYFSTPKGAIWGFDPVAFFSKQKPVKGKKKLHLEWEKVNWYFESEENLKAFQKYPEKFAPQFGGYCSHGMAHGYAARTQPRCWHIEDGKLYFNYNPKYHKRWLANRPEFIPKAEANWGNVKQTLKPQ